LPEACVLHGGRPTVVIVGVGASALPAAVAPPATRQAPDDSPSFPSLPPLVAGSKP
jgi:hypothetical protein